MKKLNVIGVCLLACAGMQASPLTPQQAIDRLNDGRMSVAGVSRMESAPVWTARTANGTATAYVFNMKDGKGYRILSADDAAYAVLGYSDTGYIDPDNMSPELKWWLEQLGAQMEYYISKGATSGEVSPSYAPMAAIDPLTKSKWNQDAPYNNDCPKIGSRITYTGCVATSMAQLMYYHKYPEIGTGTNSYGWDNGSKTLSMNFGEQAFDWNNMLDRYSIGGYNATQANAVAYLMKSCGYSVNMNYGTNASGAQGVTISYALKKYFDYDPNVNVKFRVVYSATEWSNMIYDNLKNCGPVILNGHPYQDAGHSFICDGYDGKGYFHFNWGWGGMSDGWYLLECMNPESQGIGGAAMGSAFNYGLNGIFGIQKPTGEEAQPQYSNILMYGACKAEINGSRITFTRTPWYPDGWYCAADHSIQVNVGVIIEPIDGTPGSTITKSGTLFGATRVSMSPGSYYPTDQGPAVNLPSLADGRYKVTIGVRDLNIAGAPYNPILCPYGAANYVYVTVKNGVKTVQNVDTPTLEPQDMTLETELYYSRYAQYKVKVKNPSEFELTETLSPALLTGNKVVMVGGVAPLTCAPNTDEEIIWDAKMTLVNGATRPTVATKYTLAIVNPVTNEVLGTYGEVTMKTNPGNATLRMNSLEIQNCETKSETVGSGTVQVYEVPNGNNFTVDMEYYVYDGYFDGVMMGTINKVNPESITSTELVADIYNSRKYMDMDDEETITVPVEFPEADPADLYSIQFSYSTGSTTRSFRSIYFRVKTSGIDDVVVDGTESVKYYNLQGMEIASPVKGQIVIVKKGNKTFKVKY